ncbi:MAG TPA: type II toxin-antitoxin system prevent-host-death family antitoxin [Candidatus Methylomirabilis sp.]|nr:type II toxin-antitoxin system prevent-host-death family antitoxin [Candidatus Methylomirabilis sp.]
MQEAVGIRKLRDELTRYLGRVRRGKRLVVTDRGKPVAVLMPYSHAEKSSQAERVRAILAGGHVVAAERPFKTRPPLVKGRGPLASDLIIEDRR